MNRSRRKSNAQPIILSGSDIDSESDDENRKQIKPGKRDKRVLSRFRMTSDDDESFIKLCVERFEDINNTATLKGLFTTKKKKHIQQIWQQIAEKCNSEFNVST